MPLPSTITTNLWSDFKSATIGPYPRIAQVKQETSTGGGGFGYNEVQEFAQSFKATQSGLLVSVDLYVAQGPGATADSLQIRLYDHDPDANHFNNLLATAAPITSQNVTSSASYKRIVFLAPYQVVANETYWLRASRTGSLTEEAGYLWYTSNTNPYADGKLRYLSLTGWIDASPSSDARFKVNIQQPGRYAFAVDKTNNKVRCYKTTDNTTWTEQDSANAPAVSSTANLKSVFAQAFDTSLRVFVITSSTRLDIFSYNTETDAWGSSLFNTILPTFSNNVAGVASLVGVHRSPDYFAATVASDYLFVNNGPTETVMGSARRRIKLSRRAISGGTWNTPYDVVGSASIPDATLPGTGIDYDLRGALVDSGGSLQIFWTQSDDSSIRYRSFSRGNVFGSTVVVGSPAAVTSNTAAYPMSQPVLFFKDANWWVAFAYVDSGVLKVARCTVAGLISAGNWVITSAVTATIETTNSNPAVLVPDNEQGGKLFLVFTKSDGRLYYTHDQGSDNWVAEQELHPDTKTVGALSSGMIGDAIGIQYLDTAPTPDNLKFDAINIYYVRADLAAGTFVAERDLGTNEQRDYKIVIDVEEMSGTSYLAEAYARETETDSWALLNSVGAEAVDANAVMQISGTFRHVKIAVTVTGGSSFESGVVGF